MNVEAVTGILAEDVDEVWNEVAPVIERVIEHVDGKIALSDIYQGIKSRDMQLWLIPGGVWVTRIVVYPQSKRLEWIAAAGQWDDWLTHVETIFEWARAHGCDAAEAGGRAGWGRKLGWEEIHRTFRVRL